MHNKYAALGELQLEKEHKRLIDKKKELAQAWNESTSNAGKSILERKKRELDEVLRRYARIVISGHPENIVRALIANQTSEEHIRKEIEYLEKPKEKIDGIDKELEMLNSAIEAKKKHALR